jgi:DNA-binding transcriptional LysR family regulator
VTAAAPRCAAPLRPKPDKDVRLLRDGAIDLDIGVLGETGPEARMGGAVGLPVQCFPLPVPTKPITVSQMWRPRADADPTHRWLRGLVLAICRSRG